MALGHSIEFLATMGFDDAVRALVRRLNEHLFVIHHVEDLRDADGRRVLVIFGVSNPVRGGALRSAFFQGVRPVTFVLRIQQGTDTETNVLVHAGGAESVLATDLGRNRGVVATILDGLPGEEVSSPPATEEPTWREAAPGL